MIAWECYGYVRPHYPVLGNFLKFKSIFSRLFARSPAFNFWYLLDGGCFVRSGSLTSLLYCK